MPPHGLPPAPTVATTGQPGPAKRLAWVLGALLLVGAAAVAAWMLRDVAPQAAVAVPAASAPGVVKVTASARPAYVANQLCIGCHQDAGKAWQQSHHFMAMAPPTDATVRGDFANTSFKHQGVTSRFFRRAGKFFVNTDGPDGRMADFEINYTFGLDPLQQYLIETPGGRLQPLTIAWDTGKRRWFHLYPHEKAPPGDVMHWTGRYQTGNTMCVACHTTGFEKRFDAKADAFDTRWKEPNVGCQSCHGAGETHVAWANARPAGAASAAVVAAATAAAGATAGAAPAPTAPRFGLFVDFKSVGAKGEIEVCAACHSRRAELTPSPMAGEPLLDNYQPALPTLGLYHADGQQRDEVYVYASFRQSKMHERGVRCTDCHDPHTSKLKVEGNGVCLQCHQGTPNARFPAAAGNFDSPSHHFHKQGLAGAQCVACHMPSTTYMQVDARPDHSMRIPRPDLNAIIGAPDACTSCHTGKQAAWAAAAIDRWYGPQRRGRPHFGPALAAARAGASGADAALAKLSTDPARPAVVRASALAALRTYGAGYGAERVAATRDPLRAVRIAAARSVSTLDPVTFDAPTRQAFDAALAEYIGHRACRSTCPARD